MTQMRFQGTLIAVADMERSKVFYRKYLGLDVEVDFGANVTLTGGISLQTLESWRGFIGGLDVKLKGNDAELYPFAWEKTPTSKQSVGGS